MHIGCSSLSVGLCAGARVALLFCGSLGGWRRLQLVQNQCLSLLMPDARPPALPLTDPIFVLRSLFSASKIPMRSMLRRSLHRILSGLGLVLQRRP